MKNLLLLIVLLTASVLIKAQDNNALKIMDGQSYFWCTSFHEFSTTDVTIEAWVKLDTAANVKDYSAVVDGRYGPKTLSKALIFKTIDGLLTLSYEWEGAWAFEDTDGLNVVEKGVWQHVAMVVDGGSQITTFYVNGIEGATHFPVGTEPSEYGNIGAEIYWDSLFVGGGNTDQGRTLIGLIDEIRVWSVIRSEDEIFENMTREIEPDLDLLAYYRCNGSYGDTILYDDSGWENHAVVFSGEYDSTYTFVPLTEEDWYIEPEEPEVGMNDIKLKNISTFPNPVSDVLNFKGPGVRNSEFRIFNATGQLLQKSIIYNSSIDVSYLNSGVYFIEIEKDSQVFFTKIIKK